MTTTKYEIRVGYPWQTPDAESGITRTWCRTLKRAHVVARKLTKHTRTDCAVYIVADGRVIAASGVSSGPGGVSERAITPPAC